jgi:hypothetical protein
MNGLWHDGDHATLAAGAPVRQVVHFTVPGQPVGYYSQGKHPNWTRMKAYHAYKAQVQACAQAAGLTLPLSATREAPVIVSTVAHFSSGVHCDPENVRKGVTDALFYGGSGDKHTGGSFPPPRYDRANPRVLVTVEFLEPAQVGLFDAAAGATP